MDSRNALRMLEDERLAGVIDSWLVAADGDGMRVQVTKGGRVSSYAVSRLEMQRVLFSPIIAAVQKAIDRLGITPTATA